MVAFTGKVECKKYPKAVWNSMIKKKQMLVRKLQQEQGIKPATRMASTETGVAALKAKFRVSSQTEQVYAKENLGETLRGTVWGRNRRNSVVTHQALVQGTQLTCWVIERGHQS